MDDTVEDDAAARSHAHTVDELHRLLVGERAGVDGISGRGAVLIDTIGTVEVAADAVVRDPEEGDVRAILRVRPLEEIFEPARLVI